jgi:predicted esterase
MVPPTETERLADMLREAGADVSMEWQNGGHELSPSEVERVKNWLTGLGGDLE